MDLEMIGSYFCIERGIRGQRVETRRINVVFISDLVETAPSGIRRNLRF